MECIKDIVTISPDETTCNSEHVGVSLSGLYLEDTTRGRIPVMPNFFQRPEIERIIPDAINEAFSLARMSLDNRLMKTFKPGRLAIGSPDNGNSYLYGDENRYIVLRGKTKGVLVTISKIKIYTRVSKAHSIVITQDGTELYNGLLSDYTSTTFELDEDLYISYQGEDASNFTHTGCCSSRPNYYSFMQVGSGTGDLEFLKSNYNQGIYLELVADCDPFYGICNIDFKKTNFGVLFAKLIQQIARRNIGHWILTDENLSPYKNSNGNEIGAALEYLNYDIEKMLNFLPETYDFTDCYICNGMFKKSILI